MTLTVKINHSEDIDELIKKFPAFKFMQSAYLNEDDAIAWEMTDDKWNYYNTLIHQVQVMFVGKSGYGKSTTLNKIVGKEVFDTDDITACTKELYSANYRLKRKSTHFLAFCDLPGIGESKRADEQYYEWYRSMLLKSHCVVYVLRADQRDYAIDQILFKEMFKTNTDKQKVIIAVNYADKIEPMSRTTNLTSEQKRNLEIKIKTIKKLFEVSESNIIYYSAIDTYNINLLMEKISIILKKNL